jgi:hypothetical protein
MGKQIVALKDNANILSERAQIDMGITDTVITNPDIPAIDGFEPVDTAKRCAFTGTTSADQSNNLPLRNFEIDTSEHRQRAIAFMNVNKLNDG